MNAFSPTFFSQLLPWCGTTSRSEFGFWNYRTKQFNELVQKSYRSHKLLKRNLNRSKRIFKHWRVILWPSCGNGMRNVPWLQTCFNGQFTFPQTRQDSKSTWFIVMVSAVVTSIQTYSWMAVNGSQIWRVGWQSDPKVLLAAITEVTLLY